MIIKKAIKNGYGMYIISWRNSDQIGSASIILTKIRITLRVKTKINDKKRGLTTRL